MFYVFFAPYACGFVDAKQPIVQPSNNISQFQAHSQRWQTSAGTKLSRGNREMSIKKKKRGQKKNPSVLGGAGSILHPGVRAQSTAGRPDAFYKTRGGGGGVRGADESRW